MKSFQDRYKFDCVIFQETRVALLLPNGEYRIFPTITVFCNVDAKNKGRTVLL